MYDHTCGHMYYGQTDEQTELRWLRCAKAVPAFARKKKLVFPRNELLQCNLSNSLAFPGFQTCGRCVVYNHNSKTKPVRRKTSK